MASDWMENPTMVIENATDIQANMIILRKFVHKLFFHTNGGNIHVQVLVALGEELSTIMQTIGWWLKSTSQGMWLTDLQLAKESTCTGWLLFLAGDYDHEAFSQEIWDFIGVQVAIQLLKMQQNAMSRQNQT